MSSTSDAGQYQSAFDRFLAFYKDVRNPLVHHGKTYRQLARDRKADLLYLQQLVSSLLINLLASADESFNLLWDRTKTIATQHIAKKS